MTHALLLSVAVALLVLATSAQGSCAALPDDGKKVALRVETCEEVKGVDVFVKAYPEQATSSPEKEALMLLYDGRVVGGAVVEGAGLLQTRYKVFIDSKGPACGVLVGKSVSGSLRFNCCDGDPGVPCLLEGVDAALAQPVVSKGAAKAKPTPAPALTK
jgi:hypothetical protein